MDVGRWGRTTTDDLVEFLVGLVALQARLEALPAGTVRTVSRLDRL
jgi:putative addiction module killer protein